MAANYSIGIDIGGSEVRMALRRGGIVFAQSAMVALRQGKKEYVAIGDEAVPFCGREPQGIAVFHPAEGGRVVSEQALEAWAGELLSRAQEAGGGRAHVLYCSGTNAREADLQAVRGAMLRAGAASMSVLEADHAAALGAWMPADANTELGAQVDVLDDKASLLVDIGAHGAFASLLSGGQILRRETLQWGVDSVVSSFRAALRRELGMQIGAVTASNAFIRLSNDDMRVDKLPMQIEGLDLEKKLPRACYVRSAFVRDLLLPFADALSKLVLSVLAHAPEEVCAEVMGRGIILTGGGANIPLLVSSISDAAGIFCRVSDSPQRAAARGLMRVMNAPLRFGSLALEAVEGE